MPKGTEDPFSQGRGCVCPPAEHTVPLSVHTAALWAAHRAQLQLGQGETALKSPSATQTPAAAGLRVGQCWMCGAAPGGCTLWVAVGSSGHTEHAGMLSLIFYTINKTSMKVKNATLAPSVTHTSSYTRSETIQVLPVSAHGHCIPMTLLPVANSWQSSHCSVWRDTA